MPSFEARFLASQQALRRLNGQLSVLRLQVEGARHVIDEVREKMAELSPLLIGDDRKAVDKIDRLCQDWERRNDGIKVSDSQDTE